MISILVVVVVVVVVVTALSLLFDPMVRSEELPPTIHSCSCDDDGDEHCGGGIDNDDGNEE